MLLYHRGIISNGEEFQEKGVGRCVCLLVDFPVSPQMNSVMGADAPQCKRFYHGKCEQILLTFTLVYLLTLCTQILL